MYCLFSLSVFKNVDRPCTVSSVCPSSSSALSSSRILCFSSCPFCWLASHWSPFLSYWVSFPASFPFGFSSVILSFAKFCFYTLDRLPCCIQLFVSVSLACFYIFELFEHSYYHSLELFVWKFFQVILTKGHCCRVSNLGWDTLLLLLCLCWDLTIWSGLLFEYFFLFTQPFFTHWRYHSGGRSLWCCFPLWEWYWELTILSLAFTSDSSTVCANGH